MFTVVHSVAQPDRRKDGRSREGGSRSSTSWSSSRCFEKVQKFSEPANIMAFPVLRNIGIGDDEARVVPYVSEYVDKDGTHTGKMMGVLSDSCTRIVWKCLCDHSFANPIRVVIYLD